MLHIRWMIRRDLPEVLAIEAASFEAPWTEEDFTDTLANKNCIGLVAEIGAGVVGYVIYTLSKIEREILNMAVAPDMRRMGVGRAMVEKICGKLSATRACTMEAMIRESNLGAQQFFRACGVRAVSIYREYYADTGEDAIKFRRWWNDTGAPIVPGAPIQPTQEVACATWD